MTTYMANENTVDPQWLLIDAKDKILGRLASDIAFRLRGKHKPEFTPHADAGDYVVVVNANMIKVSGKKLTDKQYHHHTGYPGGLKSESLKDLLARKPEAVIEKAVRGMLPKGPLGRKMFKKLKVYAGAQHEHQAQQPVKIDSE